MLELDLGSGGPVTKPLTKYVRAPGPERGFDGERRITGYDLNY